MLPGAWCICYQIGSEKSRWCTSTLLVTSVSSSVMSNSSQTFFGECHNDDSKHGIFMTKVQGVRNGKAIAWEQLVPTQCSSDVSTLFFKGYLNFNFKGDLPYNWDIINVGRIYTLTGMKNDDIRCHGIFTGRRLVCGLEEMHPALPAGTVATMTSCGCLWCWSLVALMTYDNVKSDLKDALL
jgi:hypothetical protein